MKLKLTKKQRGWLIGLIVALEILLILLVIAGMVGGALTEGAVGVIVTVLLLLVPVLLVVLLLTVLFGGKKTAAEGERCGKMAENMDRKTGTGIGAQASVPAFFRR